ncbi:MAG: zinc ribbon domain-containing protein, partial [Chloroflexi bacterium]|nr:zinc ribbon domain-containing protein [Chloroflexota bacterium]
MVSTVVMRCDACGAENRAGSRFCNQCGEPIGGDVSCPSCGTPNPPGSRFCSQCGSRLSGVPPAPRPSDPPSWASAPASGPTSETRARVGWAQVGALDDGAPSPSPLAAESGGGIGTAVAEPSPNQAAAEIVLARSFARLDFRRRAPRHRGPSPLSVSDRAPERQPGGEGRTGAPSTP